MKVMILYRPNSEHDTLVHQFARDVKRTSNKDLEFVDLNTRDGAATASLYDIIEYPAIVAVSDEGVLQKAWQGMQLPLIEEISYYAS